MITNLSISDEISEFKFILPKDIQDNFKELGSMRQFIRIENAFDRYPELTPGTCKDGPCWSPIIQLTNFGNNARNLQRIPTVMVISGMNGFEMMGSNVILRYIEYVTTQFFKRMDVFLLLNNLRVLFLPGLNSFGTFNRKGGEVIAKGEDSIRVDPNQDFNFLQNKECFMTNSASIVGRLFKDNLIVGVVNFGNDSHASLLTPWGKTKRHKSLATTSDFAYFLQLKEMIKSTSENARIQNYDLNYSTTPTKSMQYASEGSLEDWAFGASFQEALVNQDCLDSSSPYNSSFASIDSKSNRAFALRLNSGYVHGQNMLLGNPIALSSKDSASSKFGLIPRNASMLKQVFEAMQPLYVIHGLWHAAGDNSRRGKQNYSMYIAIYGCTSVSSIRLVSPTPLNQSFEKDRRHTASNSTVIDTKVYLTFDETNPKWKNVTDLEFEIKCDQEFAKEIERVGAPQSHLMRSKQNEPYEIRNEQWVYSNFGLNRLYLRGINFSGAKMVNNFLVYQKKFNEAEFMNYKSVHIRVGGQAKFHINCISNTIFIVEPLPNSDFKVDPSRQLMFTVYTSTSYFHTLRDDSVLKSDWQQLKEQSADADPGPKVQEDRASDSAPEGQLGITFKLNEQMEIEQHSLLWLLGQRVLIHYQDSEYEGSSQGLVIVSEALSNEDFRGTLVDLGGATCRSDSVFGLDSVSDDIEFYRVFVKQKKDMISILVELKMSIPPGSIFLKWRDRKLELMKVLTNAQGNAVYNEEVERSLYPIVGTAISLENDDSDQLLRCYMERSLNASQATSIESEIREYEEQKRQFILKKLSESAESESTNWLLYLILGLIILVTAFVILWVFVLGKRQKNAGDVEKELAPVKDMHNSNEVDQESPSQDVEK